MTRKSKGNSTRRRIIIKFNNDVRLPYDSDEHLQEFLKKNDFAGYQSLQRDFPGFQIKKMLVSMEAGRMLELQRQIQEAAKKNHSAYIVPNPHTYCAADIPPKAGDGKELLKRLRAQSVVEYAYVEKRHSLKPPATARGETSQNLRQGYLDPATDDGVDARFAWQFKGGKGDPLIHLIDIEPGWYLGHEDIQHAQPKMLWGTNKRFDKWHGTAVLGVILMEDNNRGGLGMTPKIQCDVMGSMGRGDRSVVAEALQQAIAVLKEGDVILIEMQDIDENMVNIPVEMDLATRDFIRNATEKGIIVIEAAGNGGLNFDTYIDDDGVAILNTSNSPPFLDTGAIMVGAVEPRRNARAANSNHGARVNCCAWGDGVATSFEVDNGDSTYTNDFDGTSSASAIIAGVALSIQSILVNNGRNPFTPAKMRQVLSSNSTRQISSNLLIGSMPDLKKIIQTEIPNAVLETGAS